MRRRLLWAAALAYSLLHFATTGVRQPLANFYGDFLASFPSWTMAFFFGRLDLYDGSLANQWGPPPIWHYGPVLHAITAPLFAFHSLRSAYLAWLFVNYLFVALTAVIAHVPRSLHFFNIVFFAVVVSAVIQGSTVEFLARRLNVIRV